jgi:hypothetical protein
MQTKTFKAALIKATLATSVLLLGNGAAHAQQVVNLTAAPTAATMPDGSLVPMWGYSCGTVASATTTATCAASNTAVVTTPATTAGPAVTTGWSPVVITVPYTGASSTSLTINLTNSLTFANGNSVPTSLVIVGQVGGGLGDTTQRTTTPSPVHGEQGVTWPVANTGATFIAPPQGARVQSFATEVAAGNTTSLTWSLLKPGTYLIESGTHPSIQGPMGLYGVLVVTAPPTASTAGVETAAGCAYPSATSAATCVAAPYDAEVPVVMSEIDPVQNTAVSYAVNAMGFSETTVWSGQPGGCGNPSTANAGNCYPPAVNYTPLYYLINGVAFSKTTPSNSLFAVAPATIAPAAGTTGSVLVRLVNAGLRMHVPSIVGSQVLGATGATNPIVTGYKVMAEDGNVLPGVPKIRSEIFMAAGKTYDVIINGQATTGATIASYPSALAIFDRELSLSANAFERDAGMLAYIAINGGSLPVASNTGVFSGAVARADSYPALVAGQTLTVSDPIKGVIGNDTNVYGVTVLVGPTNGALTLNKNGTFTYVPTGTATADTFTYCANGTVTGGVCSSGVTATVSLTASNIVDAGVTCTASTFSANTATYLAIKTPGVLAGCTDGAGLPLTIDTSTVKATGMTVLGDANGGFTAVAPGTGTYSFTFQAQNSHGLHSGTTTATVTFPTGSGLTVTVLDGYDKTTKITDYRWVIEEDRTFYINPLCSANPPPAGCPTAALGIVPTLGTNFHTSYMPYIAQGCTGPLSCEAGQTQLSKPVVCDLGNGQCRPDTSGAGMTPVLPGAVALDPTKRYYISILPGDAANPFNAGYAGGGCQNGTANAPSSAVCGHGMGGGEIAAGQTAITILAQPSPYPPGKLSVFVFEDDSPLNGEQDGGGGVDVLGVTEPGLGGFQIHLWDAMGGNGDFTGQMTYDMFNQPLTNSLAGTIDPVTGQDACPVGVNELSATTGTATTTLSTDPTATGITGMIVTCPKYEKDGKTLSPLAGQAVVANLMPGRWGVIATPGADRIARGEEWLQTNTLDGQKAHDVFTRIGEPSYFQEFGPASYHVSVGFANPAIINARHAYICNGTDPNSPQPGTPYVCNNTIKGIVTGEHLSRTPDERLYSTGTHDAFYWTQCYVSFGDPDGEDFAFTKCNGDGTFTMTGLPPGDWRVTVFDQWNDGLVDGLSTPIGISGSSVIATVTNGGSGYTTAPVVTVSAPPCTINGTTCVQAIAVATVTNGVVTGITFTNPGAGYTTAPSVTIAAPPPSTTNPTATATASGAIGVDMGDIATTQWETNMYTRTFIDDNKDGISQSTEDGIPFQNVSVRLRDGSLENLLVTDFTGTANFNETFPLFSWYVVETDVTRYKNTGTHVVYDVGGPVDNSAACGTTGYPPCGTSTIGSHLASTAEIVSVPTSLRVPGSVYCAGADCTGKSIQNGPATSDPPSACTTTGSNPPVTTCSTQLSSGRIDNPWFGGVEGWQGFPGQNNFLEFGKEPYFAGENGGIKGHVIYASTRPFDDPQQLVQTQWEPLVPNVTINLYQEGVASDGVTPTLTLVDHTQTSSWDAYAQGFHTLADGVTIVPNMNCPGQGAASGVIPDLFFFSLYNQPNYLDFYNSQHGGTGPTALPDDSQFKCYDGMHNWNQIQPAPYDGMYKFPSVTAVDPVTGKPTATNCTICVANPDPVPAPDLYAGVPMLPIGKYVVEVVLPQGYELVKEEDKNILIGDNFIAPVTQEFGALSNIFIIPDQASVAGTFQAAAGYNANNAQNPTTSLGMAPYAGIVPGFTPEPIWPCVGEARIVPDFISLYPQSKQVAPFAGATRNLCDRKEVTLSDQMAATAKFYVYTSTHIASKFTGGITDDYTSEFDPFSPQFGEKFSPPDLPVSVKDWAGNEITRVYADHWGSYNGMTYSTWEVNPPNPTGYSPTMMVFCMNDPGPIAGPNGTMITDPAYAPGYSQFCYELPFMPGTTQYLDTPVVPTSAFAGAGYNNVDCAYPDATPAVAEVDGDGVGPWVGGSAGSGAIASLAITSGGSGYTSAPTVTITGSGNGAAATATISGPVTGLLLTGGGSGYTTVPTVTIAGTGSGATATATLSTIGVQTVTLSSEGTGYTENSTSVTFTGGGGTGATATARVRRGAVTGITVTSAGTGYTSVPTVVITGRGSGAVATATIGGKVNGITLVNGGTGYTAGITQVIFSGGNGSGATASAAITGSVTSVALDSGGTGYGGSATVSFAGGGGSGAAATAGITGGTLTITALGDVSVPNNAYSGPSATTAPYNKRTITRHYGFGGTQGGGTVTIGGVTAPVVNWNDTTITVSVPAGVPSCAVQQQAQYGGSKALCGQLVITAANGKQSIDSVTVTVGGKAPKHIAASASIQDAIDVAAPGDLLIVDPTCAATAGGVTTTQNSCQTTLPSGAVVSNTQAAHNELLIMWKPVRLQGVGAATTIINANTQPAGKLDPWRQRVDCLFGIALNGVPITKGNVYDPTGATKCGVSADGTVWQYFNSLADGVNAQVDPIPTEPIIGWDASTNGNLAQMLQEPSLMGALEGAGITVLGKGVNFPTPLGQEASFPTGTTLLTGTVNVNNGSYSTGDANALCHTSGRNTTNPFPSNFSCNPSSIDGLGITDSSQGGGAIFVHGWNHNLQIANNRIYSNAGTLSGGINLGQGEFAPSNISGGTDNEPPGSCVSAEAVVINGEQPYCENLNVNVHHNSISLNSSTGDELYSGTPAGAGGISICAGSDYYKFNYNWVCGNLSSGDGGGVGQLGVSYNGDIEHNTIIFNQSLNPTIPANGGGLLIMGTPDVDPTCGETTDQDCVSAPGSIGPSDGIGPNLVINANLIMGNAAESGTGGGLRLQNINGSDVVTFPTQPNYWWSPTITNNIIADNVAGWDGAGVSMVDALNVNFINNTVVSNSTTASAGILFTTIGYPLASSEGANCVIGTETSCPQVAGLVSIQNSSVLSANLPATVVCPANHYQGTAQTNGTCRSYSYPLMENNIFWQNSAYYIGVGALSAQYQQNVVSLYNAFTTTLAPTQPQGDAVTANGAGATITGGTGACVAASYWDIGVRGDVGPTDHGSGVTLAPIYSVITSVGGANDYAAPTLHNIASNPNFISQYCDGSRQPPEFGSSGWSVPPGIADATVPNPIFNLTPVATVDEGNNWINLRWGPLALGNPVTQATLANYGLTVGSGVIQTIPSTVVHPAADYYGNPRPNPGSSQKFDPGAVEFVAPVTLTVTGGPLSFTSVVGGTSTAGTLTLSNTGNASGTGIALAFSSAVFSRAGGTCGATLTAGSTCTITVVFKPTATGTVSGSLTITANAAVTGSPVTLSGTGTAAVVSATLTPTTWTVSQTRNCPTPLLGCALDPVQGFTLTNTGNVTLTGITQGVLGGTAANVADYAIRPALSTCGPAVGGQLVGNVTLAPGATCNIEVQFRPLTSQAAGLKAATISVTDSAGTQTSTLDGTAR